MKSKPSPNSIKAVGRPRSEDARRSILQASLALLREVGYDRFSFEAVALRAGVGKTTIYRWYETREELVAEALMHKDFAAEIPNTGSLEGDIEAILKAALLADPLSADRRSFVMMMTAISASDTISHAYWEKFLKPLRKVFNIVYLRAKERGEFGPAADPDLFGDLLHGAVLFLILSGADRKDLPDQARRLTRQLLRGFAV